VRCQDCGCRLEVIKTMVLEDVTQRLRECGCGSRFLTTEVVSRKLPMAPPTASQPPGNRSEQSSLSGSDLSPPQKPDPDQTPARVERIVRSFAVAGKDTPPWGMPESFSKKLTAAFPGVDPEVEFAKVDVWAEANPQKRKTAKGMKRFLMHWFEKAQNSGRVPGLRAVESFAERDARLRREAEQAKSKQRAEAMRVQRELDEQLKKAGLG
jgi:hypothetical protein